MVFYHFPSPRVIQRICEEEHCSRSSFAACSKSTGVEEQTPHTGQEAVLCLSSSTLLFHPDMKKDFHREDCCLHLQDLFEGTVQS